MRVVLKTMKINAIYLRVSTTEQQSGLDSQEKALRDYADNHGLANVKWYKDMQSGRDLNRPAFKELQKDIFAGKVGAVYVWKLRRISRRTIDGLLTLKDWLDRGIKVVSTTEGFDFSDRQGKLMQSLLFAIAEWESDIKGEAISRGKKASSKKQGPKYRFSRDRLRELLAENKSISEIARILGVTKSAIIQAKSQ